MWFQTAAVQHWIGKKNTINDMLLRLKAFCSRHQILIRIFETLSRILAFCHKFLLI